MTTDGSKPPNDGPREAAEWSYGTRVDQPLADGPGPVAGDSGEPAEGEDSQDGEGRAARPAEARDASARQPAEDDKRTETARDGRADQGKSDRNGGDQGRSDKLAPAQREDEADGKQDGRSPNKDEEAKDEPPPPPPSKWVFLGTGLLLLCLLAWGGYVYWRRSSDSAGTQNATATQVTEVRTAAAVRDDKPLDLTLPGQTEPLKTASLYPRATGYIGERKVDIGSRVKQGDLLLHIVAPDLDQQLAQAEAQVGQVKAAEVQAHAQVSQSEANVNLAKVTLARTATLTDQGYETQQNRDNQTASLLAQQATLATATAGVKVAEANTKAQLATVERLRALASFEDVTAPFDGIVTVRNVDVGDLVNADSPTALPLFTLNQDDVIRVTVQVPQNAAVGVRDGLPASVKVAQLPGQIFRGTVTRSSGALLSSARTLDTEVDIPNPDGQLRAGLFAYVTISIPRDHPNIVVPAEALIFDQHGLQVAIVDDDKATLRPVVVGRDLGTSVELSEGLKGGEQVILDPPALLQSGQKVKVKPADQPAPGDKPADQKGGGQEGKGG